MKTKATECNAESEIVPLQRWLDEMGVSKVTGWRWHKRGFIQLTNIAGRNYITRSTIRKFEERALAGEFALPSSFSRTASKDHAHTEEKQ